MDSGTVDCVDGPLVKKPKSISLCSAKKGQVCLLLCKTGSPSPPAPLGPLFRRCRLLRMACLASHTPSHPKPGQGVDRPRRPQPPGRSAAWRLLRDESVHEGLVSARGTSQCTRDQSVHEGRVSARGTSQCTRDQSVHEGRVSAFIASLHEGPGRSAALPRRACPPWRERRPAASRIATAPSQCEKSAATRFDPSP
jgi:hypothetical protein